MESASLTLTGTWRLLPFDPLFAPIIVPWVNGGTQLRLLAPSTTYPLTPAKIVEWKKPDGRAFVFAAGPTSPPVAYGELNPMRQQVDHFWLGHVVVEPALRGRGVGRAFVRRLVDYAIMELSASRLSLIVFPDNEPALACYRSVGFHEVGEEYHKFGEDGLRHRLLRFELDRDGG